MKYEAVVLDLFNTLVDFPSPDDYESHISQMAEAVSARVDDFDRVWSDTVSERMSGVFDTIDAHVEYICRELRLEPEPNQITAASRVRFEFMRRNISTVRPHAVETLSLLRARGHTTGLISNCSPGIPELWQETPLAPLVNVSILSCIEGLMKPDARIYELASERLGVTPEDCLYVADGENGELAAAARVGMRPVLIRMPNGVLTAESEADTWRGPTITSLAEVLALAE